MDVSIPVNPPNLGDVVNHACVDCEDSFFVESGIFACLRYAGDGKFDDYVYIDSERRLALDKEALDDNGNVKDGFTRAFLLYDSFFPGISCDDYAFHRNG